MAVTVPCLNKDNLIITLPDPSEANIILQYYMDNRDHLAQWEPKRDSHYHTFQAWQSRLRLYLADYSSGRGVYWSVFDGERKRILAVCNYSNIVRGAFQACHLGYSVDYRYQGQGLMFKVLSKTIEYMFKEHKLHRIMANYIPENKRSRRLLQRLGFEKEGYAKKYLNINGQWQDHILTARVNEQWNI
ncbi:ribosomal protein S5-alanine N-acetyltransferase [Zooshikella marina]|uniref:ribosomal protein S5-alanine N-acetyltransferase n=1 Tax=Zooshikella ganghwensis TaxID=202772 RepID=UPI001BAE8D35|nr:ribosomal protein S5-alanine N-acetyltransferase [Zooshikella ganghwensis]MBU2705455.1 ribosomal protein S5-alanine N-acetyltransferase [Zooshikella ganghwensis]